MIVDIGGGTTEVAVCALGGIVTSTSVRTAGDEMDQDIITYARQVHNLLIGERTAEEIKIQAGSAYSQETEATVLLRGRDLATGLPKSVEVSGVEIRDALAGSINAIVDAVRSTIEITPPELIADLMAHGIALAGGGAMLRGLDRRLAQDTRFPVYVSEEPLTCVVRGTGEVLEEAEILAKVQARLAQRRPPH
jgi:rod shape-determining protein MreB